MGRVDSVMNRCPPIEALINKGGRLFKEAPPLPQGGEFSPAVEPNLVLRSSKRCKLALAGRLRVTMVIRLNPITLRQAQSDNGVIQSKDLTARKEQGESLAIK